MDNLNRLLVSLVLTSVLSSIGLAGASVKAFPAAKGGAGSTADEVVPGIVIVKLKRGYTLPEGALQKGTAGMQGSMRMQGVQSVKRAFPSVRSVTDAEAAAGIVDLALVHFASIDSKLDPRLVARRLDRLKGVEYAVPKYIQHICDVPNDAGYAASQSSYFNIMNAPAGWAIAKGSASVVIATVDGGTNWMHPDLEPNLWINAPEDINHNNMFDTALSTAGGDRDGIDEDGNGFIDDVIGWNFGNNSDNPRGFQTGLADHGTGTASTFGAVTNNASGMAGSSWNCHVMPICVSLPSSTDAIDFGFEGIQYAYQNGAKVINCSWGRQGAYSQFEQDVITAADQAGALVVAAAGNNNTSVDDIPFYPANYRHVLSVGATNNTNDVKAGFSDFGINVTTFAPGTNIYIATDNGSYGIGAGTSFSSPLVAGLAGILKSAHPSWTPDQIREQIRVTSDSVDAVNPSQAGQMGRGRVDFFRALSESHPGIDIVSASIHTPSGSPVILQHDTLVLTLTVENVLATDATNLTFTASSASPSLTLINGTATAGTLPAGQQVTLPDMTFSVGSISASTSAVIKVAWLSNTNDRDAATFSVDLFAATPLWIPQASNASTGLYSVRAVDDKVAWAAGCADPTTLSSAPGVIRTTDGGTTWTDVTTNLGSGAVFTLFASDALHAWVGDGLGAIYATANGGVSWANQAYPAPASPFIDGIWFFDSNNGYAVGDPSTAGRYVILHTTDGGGTWTHLTSEPAVSGEAGWNNSFWWTDPSHGWFGSSGSHIWRTTDGGATWSNAASGATNSVAISFRDNLNGLAGHDNAAISRSTDGGATWSAVSTPTAGAIAGLSDVPGSPSAWMVDAVDLFPYRTATDGSSWASQSAYPVLGGLTHMSMADTSTGWVVTSNGEVLAYSPGGVTGVAPAPPSEIPASFALMQNYPNPFNPSTAIGFQITDYSLVTLKVYDILGREVATLVNGVKPAGSYSVPWQPHQLASGVYFYRLTARPLAPGTAPFTSTKKMVLLK